jgi:carbonic anhydrase
MIIVKLSSHGAAMTQALLALALLLSISRAAPALAAGHGLENPNSVETAITALRDGNARFMASRPMNPNQSPERLAELAEHGQTPLAAVLACSDSRVPIEKIFDMGFGDLFVVRAAGAVPGVDQVGSLEYAVAHLGVPVILVLSHSSCGAVSAAVNGAKEPGPLGQLLKKLDPVAKAVEGLDDARKLQTAVELSAVIFREQLPLMSPTLEEAAKNGRLAIISGVYDIATGKVDLGVPPELDGLSPETKPSDGRQQEHDPVPSGPAPARAAPEAQGTES